MSLENKVALVTGSSRGIGKLIASELGRRGCKLVVHGSRRSDQLDATFEEAQAICPESIMTVAELSDSSAIDGMFARIGEVFGRLDILVNNAAMQIQSPILDIQEEDWDKVLAVNLRAPLLCAQRASRWMREAGGGKIINISSVHAYDARRFYAPYSASKGGLEILTKAMAMELAEYNIQVNSLVVGAIATELTLPDRQAGLLSAIPAGRIGTSEEIARMAAFLASGECDYLTGASITIDGGLTLGFCASRPDL